jgi:hypothetical protein
VTTRPLKARAPIGPRPELNWAEVVETIDVYCARHDVTWTEVGRRVGVHHSTMSRLRSHYQASAQTLVALLWLVAPHQPVSSWLVGHER